VRIVGAKARVYGIPATIVTPAEAEKADIVVCCRKGTPSPFDDNVEGVCSMCGHAIFFRPTAPSMPPKACMQCVVEQLGTTKQ